MSIQSERDQLNAKLLLLDRLEKAENELDTLKFNHKDVDDQEISIHLMRENYNDFSELGKY